MALKTVHDKIDEIPEEYRELYTEKDGKWELTGIAGIKTAGDLQRIQGSLDKEREAHKVTKGQLGEWKGLGFELEDLEQKLARIPELEAAAKGKLDETKIEELANMRAESIVRSKVTPLERQLQQTSKRLEEADSKVATFEQLEVQRKVHDSVRGALRSTKVRTEAEEDALLLADRVFQVSEDGKVETRDGVGVTPGLDPEAWLGEMQTKRPHWWPESRGGGAGGGRGGSGGLGKNPWTAENWNRTEQARIYKEKGAEMAGRMASAAGTTVSGDRPAAK
jgi:hypothetical protein